jgi:hypothetical protein
MMNFQNPCKCRGMNEECIFCGGSGYLDETKLEIIRLKVESTQLAKENKQLKVYLHSKIDSKDQINKRKTLNDKAKKPNPKKNKKAKIKKPKSKKKNKVKRLKAKEKKTKTKKTLKGDMFKYIGPANPHRITDSHTKPRKY